MDFSLEDIPGFDQSIFDGFDDITMGPLNPQFYNSFRDTTGDMSSDLGSLEHQPYTTEQNEDNGFTREYM